MPARAPWPTADMGWALVKISASGPMPTSRYCDQSPSSRRCSLTFMAAGEPGWMLRSEPPMAASIRFLTPRALAWSPRACSSITRSSMLFTKVTPAALSAWRSIDPSGSIQRVLDTDYQAVTTIDGYLILTRVR